MFIDHKFGLVTIVSLLAFVARNEIRYVFNTHANIAYVIIGAIILLVILFAPAFRKSRNY